MSDELRDHPAGDRFETVAITWSQPEAAVMLSMFEFYGIPAFALGRLNASIMPTHVVALQGIQVRVHADALDEALDLLGEVAARPAVVRPYAFGARWLVPALLAVAVAAAIPLLFGVAPNDGLMLLAFPAIMLLTAPPPTRTSSTFMLWKRSRA